MAKDNNNINIADELSSSGGNSSSAGGSSADALKHQGTSRTTTTDQQQSLNYGRGRTNGVLGSQPDAASSSDLQQHQQYTAMSSSQRSTTGTGPVDSESGGML